MKYKVPEEFQARFNTLVRSLPIDLQDNDEFKDSLLVHLKLGGMGLARHLAETTIKYLDVDVLEIGTRLRFPKVVEVKQDEENKDEDEDGDGEDEDKDGVEDGFEGEDENENEDNAGNDDVTEEHKSNGAV
jgi:hypothetical protein